MKDRAAIPCLWWRCSGGGQPSLLPRDLADADRASLRQYCGSAAFNSSGKILGFTSPVGGTALFVDIESGRALGRVNLPGICGIAADGASGRFVVTRGLGGAWRKRVDGDPVPSAGHFAAEAHWDNHLAV